MQKTILIVDDSKVIREVIGLTLEINNFNVLYAASATEAIKLFDGQRIDLMITDLHMPDVSGIELIVMVRNLKNYHNIPIFVLTTDSAIHSKNEGRNVGATGWIIKPIIPEKLIATIAKVIR